jgi:hypothetical protein
MQGVRPQGPPRWAAAGGLALALPAAPLGVAAVGAGSASLAILAGGAAGLAALAAWLGPAALPGTGRAGAVELVIVTAVTAWAAALDAAVAGAAVRGGSAGFGPAAVTATGLAYLGGSVWSLRSPADVWWRWPVACALTAAVWIAGQAADV